jgi:hypothetical protein
MARSRGILNDNTVGIVYANTDTTIATSRNVIASSSATTRRLSFEVTKPGIRPSVSSGVSSPVTMYTSGTVTSVAFSFRSKVVTTNAAASTATTIKLNQIPFGSSTVNVANTLTVPGGVLTSSNTLNIAFSAGDKFYIDVSAIGKPNPGQGLLVTLTYYGN